MMRTSMIAICCSVFIVSTAAVPVFAGTEIDPKGDFLPSYVGPPLADLDVTRFSVDYNATSNLFTIGAQFAGAINPATPGFYVFGVNTGTGPIAPFGAIGEPNVIFNQAIVVRKDGTGAVGATALDPSSISIVGRNLTFSVAAGLLPTTGFAPERYGFNLWPRIGFGSNSQITDFAPQNATLSATPEPSEWLLLVGGFGMIGAVFRCRQNRSRLALN